MTRIKDDRRKLVAPRPPCTDGTEDARKPSLSPRIGLAVALLVIATTTLHSPESCASPASGGPTAETATPPGRADHVAVYDPVRHRMLVWGGGQGANGAVDFTTDFPTDVWALNLDSQVPTWKKLNLAPGAGGPYATLSASAIYDPLRDRVVVYGGHDLSYPPLVSDEVWALNLSGVQSPYDAAWQSLTGGNAPQGRSAHSAIYDPVGDRMIVYGGITANGIEYPYGGYAPSGAFDSGVWAFSLTPIPGTQVYPWTQLSTSGTMPGARAGHVAFYDPVYQRMLVSGGLGAPDGAVYALQLSGAGANVWSKPAAIHPCQRVQAAAAFDPYLDEIVLWGGRDPGVGDYWTSTSTQVYMVKDWTDPYEVASDFQYTIPGAPQPILRAGASAIFDPCPAHPRMILFGGWWRADFYTNQIGLSDVSALSVLENPNYMRWDALAACNTVPGVTDLSVTGTGRHTALLGWSGVASQPVDGNATSYEVRYSTGPLTDDNFGTGTLVGQFPQTGPGQPFCCEVDNLGSCASYNFGVRVQYQSTARSTIAVASASTRCSGFTEVGCSESFASTPPSDAGSAPAELSLAVADAGSFSTQRRITYSIPPRLDGASYDLGLYDIRGRRVLTIEHGIATAARHSALVGGEAGAPRLAKGVYFARLRVAGEKRTLSLLVLD